MTPHTTRRSFLKAATVAGGTALAAPAIAQSQANIRWRLVSSFPKSLDTIYAGGAEVAERVAAMSGGRFQIQVFAAGEIVPAFGVLDAVQGGTVECGHTVMSYYSGKDFTFSFDTNLPFGLNARQQNAWFYYGGGMELIREFMKGYNIINFPAGNTGAQMGGWYRKEIKTRDDMRGLKIRATGATGQVLAKLGAVPQQIPAGDLYPALERGTIDAAEWVGPYDDEKLGLYKAAKYYYYPGWWDSGPQISLIVNLQAWESLSSDYKAMVEAACAEANVRMLAKYDSRNPPALRRLVTAGAELRSFPNEVTAEGYKRSHELFDEIAATNTTFRKIYEPWRRFRADEVLWWRITEMPMDLAVASQQGR